jgi:HlyD family secretion protein
MSTRIRYLILSLAAAAVAAGGYLYWQSRTQPVAVTEAASIRQEVVGRGDVVSTVSASGFLAAETQANLFFTAATRSPVTAVNVDFGQTVKKGDVLATFDTADLQLAVDQAEEAMTAAQVTLQQFQAPPRPEDLAVANANIKLAQSRVYLASEGVPTETVQLAYLNLLMARNAMDLTHQQMDQLVAQHKYGDKNAMQPLADQQVEDTKVANQRYQDLLRPPSAGRITSAQAGVDQANALLDKLNNAVRDQDIQVARLQIDQAQAALNLAKHNLANAQLVAPFDGVVGALNLKVGEPPPATVPAVVLIDNSRFHLDLAVGEADVAHIQPGQVVSVTLDALPDLELASTVDRIAPTSTVNQGVVSYLVRLLVAATTAPVRAGMTSTGVVIVAEARDVVLAPNWAIRRDAATGQAFAGVLKNGQVTEVPVVLGLANDTYSEIKSGLSAGDIVAVDTAHPQSNSQGSGG